jgi:hypothetical protein
MSSCRVLLTLLGFVAWCNSNALAETFTVPLTPAIANGQLGNYLSADFDFETSFSKIDSVTLEFVMPDGYEGNAATTGNNGNG